MPLDTKFRDPIRALVEELVQGHFAQLERDGRSGRLSAYELQEALREDGRTIITLSEEALHLADVHAVAGQRTCWAVDVPLWTAEEGRSDLTLSLTISESRDGVRLEIDDLQVL
jgi:hypothetical protein